MKRDGLFLCVVGTVLILGFARLQAQAPDSLWSWTYGGVNSDVCYCVQQTLDGGFVMGGATGSFGAGDWDFWLVKTDRCGNTLWSRTFGGTGTDRCRSVQQTADGGFILAGETSSFGAGSYDFWLVKTDANGDSLWSRTFGGSVWDECYCVQALHHGYILGGYTCSFGAGSMDFWLVRTNANGDSLWSRTFGGSNNDRCYWVHFTPPSGYILGGGTESFGAGMSDFWLVKTDANGDSLWSRTFGGSNRDACYSTQLVSEGYILGGYTKSFGAGYEDFWLVKTDTNGDSLWARTFGGSATDACISVQQTSDGGYVMGGYTYSFGIGTPSTNNFWLVKTNANGDSLWSRTFGGDSYDVCHSVRHTSEGGYILAGSTQSFGAGYDDSWLVRAGYSAPDIISITDVGNDQGRHVRIRWLHSAHDDACATDYTITSYSIYRRIDQYLITENDKVRLGGLDWPPGEWEYITTVPALAEEEYATIVPTLADSTSEGIYWSVYFIAALTENPEIHFYSEPDSGYSVDNLPPDVTLMTAMVPEVPGYIHLNWQAVTTGGGGQPEQGGMWYHVYGSTDPMFTPAPENLLTVTQSLEFLHNIGANDKFFYIIQASDDY